MVTGQPMDYAEWRREMRLLLDRAAPFLRTDGDENIVGDAPESNAVSDLLRGHEESIPAVLADFYRSVQYVYLSDVHNGYRIYPLHLVISTLDDEYTPVRAPEITNDRIVVFGGDDSGAMFALNANGAPVYYLPTGGVFDQVYEGFPETPAKVISEDLSEFLRKLESALDSFAQGHDDPSLYLE